MKTVRITGALLVLFLTLAVLIVREAPVLEMAEWEPISLPGKDSVRLLVDLGEGLLAAGLSVQTERKEPGGGLALSRDHGVTWTRVDAISTENSVTQVLRPDRHGPALFTAVFNNKSNGAGGVYRSTDLGKTWQRKVAGFVEPDIRDLVMVEGTQPGILAGTVSSGVYFTEDDGEHWSPRNTGLRSLGIQDLAVSPFSPDQVFAATRKGLYVSKDGGQTWEPRSLSEDSPPPLVIQVVLDPTQPRHVYALERGNLERTLLWRSTDLGESWEECGRAGTPAQFHPRVVHIDPDRSEVLYLGTVYDGVYRTTNGGETWSAMNSGMPISTSNIIVHDLLLLPGRSRTLLAATDHAAEIYRTTLHDSLIFEFARTIKEF